MSKVSLTISHDEMTLQGDNARYEAMETNIWDTCHECAFSVPEIGVITPECEKSSSIGWCAKEWRKDQKNIVWVLKE